jgi:hypothetical protein
MKKISLLLLGFALAFNAFSQKPVISFESKSYDFGKLAEEDEKAIHVFDFINTGNSPLVINRVQASCGCTTPTWTKEPIEPGKKGTVTVVYSTVNRPGAFTKSITVYSNATDNQAVLIIKGEVVPKSSSLSSSAQSLPVLMGGTLRLKSKIVQMNNVDKGKTQMRELEILNSGKSNIKVGVENMPKYLIARVVPQVLGPNESGKIIFTLSSALCSQWGPLANDVYVTLNGQKSFTDDYQIKVISNIVEDFSKLTLDQKRKAPIFDSPTRTIDLGVVTQGLKKTTKVKISNKGVSALEIRRVINNNKELAVNQNKLTIAGGRVSALDVALDASALPEGDYKKSITVQTNDPDNSYVMFVLSWKVKK